MTLNFSFYCLEVTFNENLQMELYDPDLKLKFQTNNI